MPPNQTTASVSPVQAPVVPPANVPTPSTQIPQPKRKWPWWVKLLITFAVIILVLIGLFWASIFMVSLNDARENVSVISSVDAAGTAANAAATNGNYSNVCQDQTVTNDLGQAAQNGVGDSTKYGCYASQAAYMLIAPLKSSGYYCVDSYGNAGTFSANADNAASCKDFPGFVSKQ